MKVGRVYKIVHHQSDIVYVGSTFNELRYRFYDHKKKDCSSSIGKYIQKYGKKNFTIMLIKEYQVCDKKHLHAWEQFWINKLICINQQGAIPFLWIDKKNKIYRENNKDKKHIVNKIYREKNKEKIKKNLRKYYQKNKEKILQKHKQKIKCEICNCLIRKQGLREHMKTKKHINNL
jgi:hypothetical protein